jgi:branched-subunit amino acid transport protein
MVRQRMMRTGATMYFTPTTVKSALAFVCFNVADAWLTDHLLSHQGVEAVWWSSAFNSDVFVKGLMAFLVAILLIRIGKPKLLTWLNVGMILVVLSNGICFLSYLGSWLYWQTQIVRYP